MATATDDNEKEAMVEASPSTENGGIPHVSSSFKPLPDTPVVDGVIPANPSFVEIVAPSNMPGGYQFSVDVRGRHMIVAVPEGGVKENDMFKAAVLGSDDCGDILSQGHNIPVGEWRDDVCDCCTHGCCHPQMCLTIWMTPLALGQILTRLKLDWLASPLPKSTDNKQVIWTAFRVLLLVFVGYQFLDTFFYYLTFDSIQGKYDPEQDQVVYPDVVPAWANAIDAFREALTTAYMLFMLFITIRTRSAIRSKYVIPQKKCVGCEDFCCSLFCCGCTICQMARHTADYNKYSSSCCTETGLDYSTPHIV